MSTAQRMLDKLEAYSQVLIKLQQQAVLLIKHLENKQI